MANEQIGATGGWRRIRERVARDGCWSVLRLLAWPACQGLASVVTSPGPFWGLAQRAVAAPAVSRLLAKALPLLDRWSLRLSGHRISLTGLVTGLPLIMLTATGARSGRSRRVPLLGIPDGERLVVLASNWGQRRHPAWYHNVCAHPEVVVTANGRSGRYLAREVAGAEREALWQRAVTVYSGYAAYAQRTGDRHIPVILLTPREEEAA